MKYCCMNESCPRYLDPVELTPDDNDIVCPTCGWMRAADYGDA